MRGAGLRGGAGVSVTDAQAAAIEERKMNDGSMEQGSILVRIDRSDGDQTPPILFANRNDWTFLLSQ